VKRRCGNDFPVWCRLDAHEYRIDDGITLEESCETAKLVEAAGVDALHVSAYGNPFSGIAFTEAPLVHEPGGFLKFAETIKRHVSVPVIAVGRITPEEGNRVLRDGKADFIAMGRRLLADPELPNKLAAGRTDDIRPCVYCYTCVGNIFVNESMACAVNPATGHEAEFELEKADRPRKILVVGGGPGGMEAARVAALRGHDVTLCEKENHLGGALFFSSLLWEPNGDLIKYLETQIHNLSIDVRLGEEVTREFVARLQPDAIVVASGARHEQPAIPGIDGDNVFAGDELRQLMTGGGPAVAKLSAAKRAVLKAGGILGVGDSPSATRKLSEHWLPFGQRIVVIGGGLVGIELAEFLADRGRSVTVVEEGEWLAPEMAIPRRWRSLHQLRQHGATLLTGTRVEEITREAVVATTGGERKTIPADHVIVAAGTVADESLAESLRPVCAEVHVIGDCTGVGYLKGAIADGARVGRQV
jgi:2,4-dienoyl-CoA reductase (NADPH2)